MNKTDRKQAGTKQAGPTSLSCKLTTPELRQRKKTVIASLKKQVLEKRELENGFSYRFTGADAMVNELAEFIKTERICCDFFEFSLSVSGRPDNPLWLTITGPEGVKDFIAREIGL
ncbi:hypothetical protein [Compostibacter hankyongensis]